MSGGAIIKAIRSPLVAWIWIGGGLMVLGTLLAFVPIGFEEKPLPSREQRQKNLRAIGLALGIAATGLTAGLIGDPATGVAALNGVCVVGVVVLFGDALYRLAAPGRTP
jgi:hypothetical protein